MNSKTTTTKAYHYSHKRYSNLYNELNMIGFDRIQEMSDDMKEIIFSTV